MDDGLAAEDDVRGADDLGAAGDFVAGVLERWAGEYVCMDLGLGRMGEGGDVGDVRFRCTRLSRVFGTWWLLHGRFGGGVRLELRELGDVRARQKCGHVEGTPPFFVL